MLDEYGGQQHVFISYARADGREYADRLYRELTERRISAWRDERNLDPYQDFSGEIETAIEQSWHVVVCLTPSITTRKDSFVRREIIYAQGCEKPITPLLFPEFPKGRVPTLINHLTWLDFVDFDRQFPLLLDRLSERHEYIPPEKAPDPFEDYLRALYREIVQFLNDTVFSLIALHAESTPGAVDAPKEARYHALPMTFLATSLTIKPTKSDEPPEEKSLFFDNFPAAFEYYGGRVLLLGEPGAGKTTTLMAFTRDAIARRLEDPSLPLPLVAHIADWPTEPPLPLIDWFTDKKGLDRAAVTREVEGGRALLLLDALDELGSEREDRKTKEHFDPRQRFLNALQDLSETNQTLVSCRAKDYQEIGDKIALRGGVTLQPLDDAQLAEYLRDQPDLWVAVQADAALRDMVRTPLLLSLMTFAYQNQGEKARDLYDLNRSSGDLRSAIFTVYIERRYQHERLKSFSVLPYTLSQIYELLGLTAAKSVIDRQKNRVWQSLKVSLGPKVEEFVSQALRLHILTSDDQGNLRFIHLLVRDFFALSYSLSHIYDSKAETRRRAVQALEKIGDASAEESLITSLYDPDVRVRRVAARVLKKIGTYRSVEPLIAALGDPDNEVKRRTAEALGTLGSPDIVETFATTQGSPDINLKQRIVESLEKALMTDPSHAVRRQAVWALQQIGEPAIKSLVRGLNSSMRSHVVRALKVIGASATESLMALLKDPEKGVPWGAITALGVIKASRAVELLIALLRDSDESLQWGATEALGEIGDPRAVEPLITVLKDTSRDWHVRGRAAVALIKLGTPEALQAVKAWE